MLKLQTSSVVGEYLSSYNQYCYSHPFNLPINKAIIIIQYQNHTMQHRNDNTWEHKTCVQYMTGGRY